jgi:hypothetical protein
MNPALILAALLFLSRGNAPLRLPPRAASVKNPTYFDTFRLEMLLDRLHSMTDALEKVNHLNRLKNVPMTRGHSLDRIQESLEAVRSLLYTSKSSKKLDTISGALSGLKQLGDIPNIMTNIGPILSILSNRSDK